MPRRLDAQCPGQPLSQAFQRDGTVAGLGALVGGDHANLRTEAVEEASPLTRPERW